MKTAFASILFVASLASFSQAADVKVNVGGAKGENIFEPAKVMAAPGDNIVFTWVSGKHSVIETDSLTACAKSAKPNAFSSEGAFLAPKDWTYTIPKDTPAGKTWFYCGVPGHCAPGTGGMAATLIIGGDAAPGGATPPANGTNGAMPSGSMPATPSDAAKSSASRSYQSFAAAGVLLSSMCMAAAYVL